MGASAPFLLTVKTNQRIKQASRKQFILLAQTDLADVIETV